MDLEMTRLVDSVQLTLTPITRLQYLRWLTRKICSCCCWCYASDCLCKCCMRVIRVISKPWLIALMAIRMVILARMFATLPIAWCPLDLAGRTILPVFPRSPHGRLWLRYLRVVTLPWIILRTDLTSIFRYTDLRLSELQV